MHFYIFNKKDTNKYIKKEYLFIEVLIWLLFSKFILKIENYRHQNISIIGIAIIGTIRWYFSFNSNYKEYDFFAFLIELVTIIINSAYYGYIKGLMEYKFLSPYTCCFIIGIICSVILIIVYIIISFIPDTSNYIHEEIAKFTKFEVYEYFLLIILIFIYGIEGALFNRAMNNFSFYHILIPIEINAFIENIIFYLEDYDTEDKYFFIRLALFFIEFLMYLVFLEVIQINCCGLNKNIKKKIKERAMTESLLLDSLDNRDSVLDGVDEEDNNNTNDDAAQNKELFDIDN